MKSRPTQFGVHENTASSRQHASRRALSSSQVPPPHKSPAYSHSDQQPSLPTLAATNRSHVNPNDTPTETTGEERTCGTQLLTADDVAELLHVPLSWVYQHTRRSSQHRIPFLKIGRYVRFRRTDLNAYLDRQAAGFGS